MHFQVTSTAPFVSEKNDVGKIKIFGDPSQPNLKNFGVFKALVYLGQWKAGTLESSPFLFSYFANFCNTTKTEFYLALY